MFVVRWKKERKKKKTNAGWYDHATRHVYNRRVINFASPKTKKQSINSQKYENTPNANNNVHQRDQGTQKATPIWSLVMYTVHNTKQAKEGLRMLTGSYFNSPAHNALSPSNPSSFPNSWKVSTWHDLNGCGGSTWLSCALIPAWAGGRDEQDPTTTSNLVAIFGYDDVSPTPHAHA